MEETFGDVMTKAAENKRKNSTDEEYNDWLCQLSEEFESSVCMCREDNGLGIFKSFSKKYSSVQLVDKASNKILKEEKL